MAQEEARNVSENVKWNVQRRFREGVPIVNHQRFLGYTKDKKGGNLIIEPNEAKLVKLIFNLYISGVGPSKIVKQLKGMGAKTGAGKTEWRISTITSILKNEKYMGDMLQQKTISVDYLNHVRVKNKDHAPTYYTENSHEAIIDKETFELAQRIRKDRAKVRVGQDKNLAKYTNTYPLSAMIVCKKNVVAH
jgi:site-specific DNA recombinase